MKKVMVMLVAVILMSSTANAQKDTTEYKNGWVFGSAKNAMGVYLAPDESGVKFKTVLRILEDSVKFNDETYWVEISQDRGVSAPVRFKDCYLFIIQDKNGKKFYMYLEKVNNRNAYNKYHFVLKKDERDEIPMITSIVTKPVDPDNLIVDAMNKREAREKQWWFNKLFANK